ncbi:hypothetical protein TIFTF001_008863 [Ficus carica]|uniref:Spindle and kinetochore-associated protein 3 n=1 Tax=Ficus carica TaxID=3494 RepID=A0AA87ZNU1_FICCA|nr:hypothetical protein TIFTF001_008863 [Ficus carica]
MEESITSFCRSLASFSNHLDSSCDALKQSLLRRPIPLDSASSTFIQCLNRRVSTAGSELNLLESMSLGTVSLEELLGHCNEVYKNNQIHLLQLQDRLQPLGFVPEVESHDGDELLDENSAISVDADSKIASSSQFSLDDDDLDRSEDLKEADYPTLGVTKEKMHLDFEDADDDLKLIQPLPSTIKLSKDDYESLPSLMKGLASWELFASSLLPADNFVSKLSNKFYNFCCILVNLKLQGSAYVCRQDQFKPEPENKWK